MATLEGEVKRVLESWGFSAEMIPVSTQAGVKTPDLSVEDEASRYLIEVKERDEDPAVSAERSQTLGVGELFAEHLPLSRTNTNSGVIRDAAKQLKAHGDKDTFRLVWLIGIGEHQEAKYHQFKAALYGTTNMFDLDAARVVHMPCYFFRDSEFFRHRAVLDAAIISTQTAATLCLNPMSPRFEDFKATKLCRHFGTSICDPLAEVDSGQAYIVDAAIDRSNENAVIAHLREKHNAPKLMHIEIGEHSATVAYKA
jgi:hypothetical protein